MNVHAFTSCSYSYLNRARVLGSTLRTQHPDWVLWLVLTDKEPDGFTFDIHEECFDRIITVDELFQDGVDRWLFGHDIVEACTAVKGRACCRILEDVTCSKLFYFDPDIAVFNSMREVVDLLDDYSIVLTPHQTDPESSDEPLAIRDNEITSLDYGVFNLGFVAIANNVEGQRFSQWWDDRLCDWCHDRLEIGLFVDQKWCNLVPCFFDNVKILRDPGYNVASWNLSQRVMHFDKFGTALINGRPLRFYHFTKLGPVGDVMTRRYAKDNKEIYELWWWYRQAVQKHSTSGIPKGWWYYGTFDNGVKIPKSVRELYRERLDLRAAFPNPFASGLDSFHDWLCAETNFLNEPDKRGFQAV